MSKKITSQHEAWMFQDNADGPNILRICEDHRIAHRLWKNYIRAMEYGEKLISDATSSIRMSDPTTHIRDDAIHSMMRSVVSQDESKSNNMDGKIDAIIFGFEKAIIHPTFLKESYVRGPAQIRLNFQNMPPELPSHDFVRAWVTTNNQATAGCHDLYYVDVQVGNHGREEVQKLEQVYFGKDWTNVTNKGLDRTKIMMQVVHDNYCVALANKAEKIHGGKSKYVVIKGACICAQQSLIIDAQVNLTFRSVRGVRVVNVAYREDNQANIQELNDEVKRRIEAQQEASWVNSSPFNIKTQDDLTDKYEGRGRNKTLEDKIKERIHKQEPRVIGRTNPPIKQL